MCAMTIVVFCGPTLAAHEVCTLLPNARVLPPVSQGDVLREAQSCPTAMVLIDGYFEGVPSVWHKEILWALERGIRMFGASSMGALRAAELADFGMVGHGEVYRLFACGALEDDDEVAITHGPAELGYPSCSEAMVNIRATLAAAQRHGVVSHSTSATIQGIAKSLFFADRTIDEILRCATPWVNVKERDDLRRWWQEGRVDLKKDDAIDLLKLLASGRLEIPQGRNQPSRASSWRFEPTLHWLRLEESVRATASENVHRTSRWSDAHNEARLRNLPPLESFARFIVHAAASRGTVVSSADHARVAEMLCVIAEMRLPSDVDAWLCQQGYEMEGYRSLIGWVATLIRLFEDEAEFGAARANLSATLRSAR